MTAKELGIYSRDYCGVLRLIVCEPFEGVWSNYLPRVGRYETKAKYHAGAVIECTQWRPEGFSRCVCDGQPDMFLSWDTLAAHCAIERKP